MNFTLNEDTDPTGTCLQGYFTAVGNDISRYIGEPENTENQGDGRVTRRWRFESTAGYVVTLYEYKETSVYGDGPQPTPEELMAMEHKWHVGADNSSAAAAFILWLQEELK